MSLFNLFGSARRARSSKATSSRRLGVEALEERQLLAAKLYVDFGFGFTNGTLRVNDTQMRDSELNGPLQFGAGHDLISLTRTIQNRSVGINGDRLFDVTDSRALADQVLGLVRRAYEPFAVTVEMRSSSNLDQVKSIFRSSNTKDAYVFVAGASPNGPYGWAQLDERNDRDNVCFAFADLILQDFRATAPMALARVATHEPGHTFGLDHVLGDSPLTQGHALASPGTSRRFDTVNLFHNWTHTVTDTGNPQNDYTVLAANVGLRQAGPAFVTGTGAFDRIRLTSVDLPFIGRFAHVQVDAFRDAARTQPLGSPVTYFIAPGSTIVIESGYSHDRIEIDGTLGTQIFVRSQGYTEDEVVLTGTSGVDTVSIDGRGTRLNSTEVIYDDLRTLEINTDNGDDVVRVFRLPNANTTVKVDLGGDNDTAQVSGAPKGMDDVKGQIEWIGGTGTNTLTFKDDKATRSTDWTLTTLQNDDSVGLVSRLGSGGVRFRQLSTVTLDTGMSVDRIAIYRTLAGATTVINSGSGSDVFSVGGLGIDDVNLMDRVHTLTLNAGLGMNTVLFNNQNQTAARTYGMTTSPTDAKEAKLQVAVWFGAAFDPITFRDFTTVYLNGGTNFDGINIQQTPTGASTFINGGLGNDVVRVGGAGASDRVGALTFDGREGTNQLVIDDQLQTAGKLYTLTDTRVSRSGLGPVNYRQVQTLNVYGGAGSDTLTIQGRPAVTSHWFNGGGGTNTLVGPNLANTWALTRANGGALNGNLTFDNVASLKGGTDADTFAFRGGRVSWNIEGSTGANKLDYSAYNLFQPVTVNLMTGKATGVDGVVRGIQYVIGGAGDDLMIGDNAPNWFEGRDGSDVLVGMYGADRLEGGNHNDIVIGGHGADKLFGGRGEDVVIGGWTVFDNNEQALRQLLSEWKFVFRGFDERKRNLKGDTTSPSFAQRGNSDKFLRPNFGLESVPIARATVFDDGVAIDKLVGGESDVLPNPDRDWIFAAAVDQVF